MNWKTRAAGALALALALGASAAASADPAAAPTGVANDKGGTTQVQVHAIAFPDPYGGLPHVVRPGDPLPVAIGVGSAASVSISLSAAATTQLVAAVTGKLIYVNAYDFIAGGASNVTLEYGTGSNCATGTTALTGPYPLTAQTGVAASGGNGPKLIVPASNALCVVNSAAVQVSGSLSYAQQ